MRVLIVGCGYVGSAAGAELVRRGHQVWGLRRRPEFNAELRAVGIEPWTADIRIPGALEGLPREFDWVVNCAAAAGSTGEDYRRVYVEGMGHVLDWLALTPPRKFVYTSSTGVYGQDDGGWVTETDATQPTTETGRILVAAEAALLARWQASNFPLVILRVAGIYGPGRGYYLRQLRSGQARLGDDAGRHVNMVHRDDVATAICAAFERGQPGSVYNICDDEPVALGTLYAWLAARLNLPPPSPATEEPPEDSRRSVTDKRIANTRLKTELGWQPRYPTFREGYLRETAT